MCLTQKYIFWSPWWPLGVAKTNSMSPCSWDIFDYILQIILFIKEAYVLIKPSMYGANVYNKEALNNLRMYFDFNKPCIF